MTRHAAADPFRTVDVRALAEAGAGLAGALTADRLPRLLASVDAVDAPARFRWTGAIDRQGHAGGTLDLTVEVSLCCDLCRAPLRQTIASRRPFRFVASDAELARVPVTADDDVDWLVGDTAFDLIDLIDQEAVLALPLSPRHAGCQAALDQRPSPDAAEPSALAAALTRVKPGPH